MSKSVFLLYVTIISIFLLGLYEKLNGDIVNYYSRNRGLVNLSMPGDFLIYFSFFLFIMVSYLLNKRRG